MNVKNLDIMRDYVKKNEKWPKLDIFELTGICFFYLSAYDPDMNLRDTLEIVNQLKAEQKAERMLNNERNEL